MARPDGTLRIASRQPEEATMRRLKKPTRLLAFGAIAIATAAQALPIQLKDSNGTQYNVNTQVSPLITDSLASGALTDATYTQPITVTSYYYFETFFGGISTATVKYDVNVPLTPAFIGFNGLLITSMNGVNLPSP